MKKHFNIIVFCLTIIYYIIYFLTFEYVFINDDIYNKYFECWYVIFWLMFLPNIIFQSIAIVKRKKSAVTLLILGITLGLFTHVITVGQGV